MNALQAVRRRPLLVLLALLNLPFALPSLGAERRLTREYLVRRSQEVAKAISAARGLPVLAPVRADLLTRSDLVDLVRLRMNEETPPEEIRAEGVLLERLGVIDSASEYEQQLYDMFEQQIAGLYDPDDKTLYVLTDLVPVEAELTLWHEIVHVLQDQSFHVGERQDALEDDGDRSLAYSAICEGDATLTSTVLQTGMGWESIRWMFPDDAEAMRWMYVPQGEGAGGVPTELLEVLSFPYVEGVIFVRRQWQQGGIAAIDDLFRRPPESTEQVIHPEKYGGPDVPVPVRLAERDDAFPGRAVRYEDTMGEFVIRVWLSMFLSSDSATRAAVGWGGDRIGLVVPTSTAASGCAAGATPLDDRLWACGASAECGAEADVRLGEAEGWVVWATQWDPAAGDHAQGGSGEAEEFFEMAVAALRTRVGSTKESREADATAARLQAEISAAGPAAESLTEILDPAAVAGTPEATIVEDESGRRMWVGDGDDAVAAVRIDGLRVHLVIGPPGRAGDLVKMLDELATAVAVEAPAEL